LSLTDSATEPRKWTFPAIEIPAHGYQIVFASDKNRRNPANELHTNFKLSSDGEYLALIRPDQNVAHEFQPSFPAQTSDQSFGYASQSIPLVQDESVYAVLQPSADNAQETAWRDTVFFDDSSWQEASGAIGFDVNRTDTENAGFEHGDLSEWQSRGPVRIVDGSFGVVPSEGEFVALATTRDSSATRAGAEFALGLPSRSLDQVNGGGVQRVSAVRRSIFAQEGTEVTVDWNYLTNDDRDGDFAFVFVSDESEVEFLADPLSELVDSATIEFSRNRKNCPRLFTSVVHFRVNRAGYCLDRHWGPFGVLRISGKTTSVFRWVGIRSCILGVFCQAMRFRFRGILGLL